MKKKILIAVISIALAIGLYIGLGFAITEKTIELAVSPSLKSYGIPGRPRLFELVQKVKAFFPEVPLIVDAKGCAGVSPDSHQRSLEAMKVCQIKIIND